METNDYLLKLFQTIRDMEEIDLFPASARLSKTEFRLIREVVLADREGRGIISSELARSLGVTRSAVSQTVSKLEDRGIVRREGALGNDKIAYIRLTDEAEAVFEAQCEQANRIIESVIDTVGERKITTLVRIYDEFSAALRRAREQFDTDNQPNRE